MIEETLLEWGFRQVPALVVLVVLVLLFLRAHGKYAETLTDISNRCHDTQLKTTEMTSEAINRNTLVLGELKGIIDRLNSR